MNPKLKLNVQMSRVRQPNRSLVDNHTVIMDTQEQIKEDSCGRIEMLHLHSEVHIDTPTSGGEPDSFMDEGDQGSVGDEMNLKTGGTQVVRKK